MSLIVSTSLGRFRQVVDSQKRRSFLFECPICGDWLPMTEEHLNGTKNVSHLKKGETNQFCEYFGAKSYGATLVATMQVRILMEEKPYDTNYDSLELGE